MGPSRWTQISAMFWFRCSSQPPALGPRELEPREPEPHELWSHELKLRRSNIEYRSERITSETGSRVENWSAPRRGVCWSKRHGMLWFTDKELKRGGSCATLLGAGRVNKRRFRLLKTKQANPPCQPAKAVGRSQHPRCWRSPRWSGYVNALKRHVLNTFYHVVAWSSKKGPSA